MNLFKRILLIILAAGMFTSCSTTEPPEAVVEKFEAAMNRLDFETAKAYAANDIVSWVEIVKMGISVNDVEELKKEGEKISVKILEVTYTPDKNRALVKIEVANGADRENKERYLVKQDGKWKVTAHWVIPE